MEIRPVRTGEGARLRELRLQAIRNAPEAFFFPLDTEANLTAADWERWAGAEDRVMFVAVEYGRWLGMAGCALRPDGSGTLDATGMWVTPAARGRRLGELLIDEIVEWGRHRGATVMEFAVTESNTFAIGLYRRLGFTPTGRRRRLASNPQLAGIFMARAI